MCLSVCVHCSPGTLHKPGGRRRLSDQSLPCSLRCLLSSEPPTSTHGHTTTAPGCTPHDLGEGQGEGQGMGQEWQVVGQE